MKRNFKLIISILLVIILSGCSANINIKLDKNNKASENIKVSESNSMLAGDSADNYVNEEIDYENIDVSSYEKNVFNDGDSFGIDLSKESDSICDIVNRNDISKYFKEISCESKSDYYEINGVTTLTYCPSDAMYCSRLKNINITIELPEKAIYSNASSVDEKKYTWNFDRDTKEGKISLRIKKYNTTTKVSGESDKKNNMNNRLSILILVGIALVIVFIGISLYEKYKKNKIEY